jgi:hypothetical protein
MQAKAQATAREYASRPAAGAWPAVPAAAANAAPAAASGRSPDFDSTDPQLALACPNCRAAISLADTFCGACGNRLR